MDNIFYEKTLNRIIQGRLRFSRNGLVLFIVEPSNDLVEESYDVYDETYKEAYFSGVYIKEELKELLFYNELWSPSDDAEAEKIQEQIEELKLQAFQNYYKARELRGIKANIRFLESNYLKAKSKFHQLDHISCEGVASFAKSVWVLSKTVFYQDGAPYDFKQYSLNFFLDYYNQNQIDQETFRYIARNEPFRSMWNCSKKNASLFNRSSCDYTKDQISLCSYSSMYDNVYESTESPHEDVIKDDDCLDGWFIQQRREYEKGKKQKEIQGLLKNSKIANSDEIFIMAKDKETADKINSMNTAHTKNIIESRNKQISEAGSLKFTELSDVKQDMLLQSRSASIQKIKGR